MNKSTKIWLIIAASLVLVGCLAFAVTMAEFNWNFAEFSTVRLETTTHEIEDSFENITVIADTADVSFVLSDDSSCKVVCVEDVKAKHLVSVSDGTLNIQLIDEKQWYDYISIGLESTSPEITVYLPAYEYGALNIKADTSDVKIANGFSFESMEVSVSTGDVESRANTSGLVKIKTSTGDVSLEEITVGALDLTTSTGDVTVSDVVCEGELKNKVTTGEVELTNVICRSLDSTGGTGDLFMENVIVVDRLSVERSSGDVSFVGCDAAEIVISTSTGDVEGTLLSDKIYIIKTSTGDVNVPDSAQGGRCEITTSTGDVKIRVRK